MKKKLVNPHDSLFRQVWSDPENARGFLSAWLPGETVSVMNMDTLEICRDSYVSKSLRTYYSDILYKVRLADRPGYVYLLFEHKSEPDSMTPFQLLKYMVRIWEQYHRETGKKGRLPVIIPLVLYQGRAEWGIGDRFSSVVENSDSLLHGYLPDFRYQLCDLSAYSDDEIKGNVISRVMLLAMKHIKDNDLDERLPGILSLLHDLLAGDPDGKSPALQYVETLLRYICAAADNMTEDRFEQAIKKSFPENSEVWSMATLAEKWFNDGIEKGFEQGVEKGIEQGIRKGLLEGIEMAVTFRFGEGSETEGIMAAIRKIENTDRLKNFKKDIMSSVTAAELIEKLS